MVSVIGEITSSTGAEVDDDGVMLVVGSCDWESELGTGSGESAAVGDAQLATLKSSAAESEKMRAELVKLRICRTVAPRYVPQQTKRWRSPLQRVDETHER